MINMNKQPCNKCGAVLMSYYLKNGTCRGCLNPELIVTAIVDSDTCPKCKSSNISNEDAPHDDGSLDLTCHDCSYQWNESA